MRTLLLLLAFIFSLQAAPFDHIIVNQTGENRIGHILIDDRTSGITQSTWVYVRDALEYYKKERPIFIILELNTPGGEVYAAQKISDALKEMDTQLDIPVVAFVNNWAISAGAMLAYSSRYITTVKDGSMGAAEPVLQGEGGKQEVASEKINSAIRTDFANRASFYDRNPYIAEAMVDKDVLLVMREGKVIRLDNDTQMLPTDILVSPKGKLLTLTAKEMLDYGVANLLIMPAKVAALTESEKESGRYPAAKSLLFTAPFFKDIPNATIDSFRLDWKGKFFSMLAHPAFQSVLFLLVMMGFYMEFSTPGFGIPGTIAATALILIVLSSFAQEIAGMLEVVLLLVGLGIILVDLFVLPTFGLLGIIGLIFFVFGLFSLMLPGFKEFNFEIDTQTVNAAGESFLHRLTWLAGTFLVGLFLIVLLAKTILPRFKGYQKFMLGGDQEGWSSNPSSDFPAVGTTGKTLTPLRPSGKVEVNGVIYDALTSGTFLDENIVVTVTSIDGSSVIVMANSLRELENL